MRSLGLVAAVVLIGGSLWLLLGGGSDRGLEFDGPETATSNPERRDPTDVVRSRVDPPTERVTEPPPDTGTATTPPGDPDPTLARVELEVFDRPTGEAVSTFRYVIGSAERLDATVEGHTAALDLAHGQTHAIRIEAEGYLPQQIAADLAVGETARRLRVELEPIMQATGVELHLTDPLGQPVAHARVRAERRPIGTDQPLTVLWERQASDANGVYPLPDLEPGQYAFSVSALDDEGAVRLLVPIEHRLTYHAAEHVPVHLQFADGAMIELTVTDARGTPLGQEVGARVTQHNIVVAYTWIASVDGELLAADNMLPAATACRLEHPIAPGAYVIELRQGDGPLTRRAVQLVAGALERVDVRLN